MESVLSVTGTEVVVVSVAPVPVALVPVTLVPVTLVPVPPVAVPPVVPAIWPAFVAGGTAVVVTPVNPGPGTSIVIDL